MMWRRFDNENDIFFLNFDRITSVHIDEEHLDKAVEIATIDGEVVNIDSRALLETLCEISAKQ